MAAMVVLLALVGAAAGWSASAAADSAIAARRDPPRITIAVVPQRTAPAELAGIDGMAVGLLSAGIGRVSPAQTFVDMSQGSRLFESLYDGPLPLIYVRPGRRGHPAGIAPRLWQLVRRRAADAPADLVPGLLGSTLEEGGVPVHVDLLAGSAAAIVADERGRAPELDRCSRLDCPGVSVVQTGTGRLPALVRGLGGDDLAIAIERPPPRRDRQLTIGIAGAGFRGTLTSDSTRMRGYVLSTDVAPTLLDRLGLGTPDEMNGQAIRAEGEADPAYLRRLDARLAQIGPRRGPVIGTSLLVWVGLTALAGLAFGPRGLRTALPLLAVTVAYLPALLLLTAALRPSELAEGLIAGIGSPALALLTLRLVPGYGALAIAAAVSVLGYAVDVVAGSRLTELSLVGPNPALGVRFFGIGNELEAVVAALVPIGTGAALAAWAPRASPRAAAVAFALSALVAVAAFTPGRFGADVGAAIGIPIGAAVAAAACLGARTGRGRAWPRALLPVAAVLVALGALAGADLLLGGDAHLTRSVLRAGGFDQLADIAERRLRLSAKSFGRYADTPMLWVTALLIVAGIAKRGRVEAWFGDRRAAWAGLLGAAAATAAGTLANDSGALLLIIGTALTAMAAGLAWAVGAATPSGSARVRPLFSSLTLRGGLR